MQLTGEPNIPFRNCLSISRFYTIVRARLSIRLVNTATRYHPERRVVCIAKDLSQNSVRHPKLHRAPGARQPPSKL